MLLTWQAAADLLDTAPGVDQKAAYQALAEMSINMRQFPTANHLAARGGLVQGVVRVVANAFPRVWPLERKLGVTKGLLKC